MKSHSQVSWFSLRRNVLYAWLSYRGLFTWLNPIGYISSRIVQPITIAVIFGLFMQSVTGNALPSLLGAGLLAVSNALLFGVTMAIANERQFGTLGLWVSTPEPFLPSLLARSFPHVLDGVFAGGLTLSVGFLVFDIHLPAILLLQLIVPLMCAAFSAMGLSIFVASYALRTRDTLGAPNFVAFTLTVFTGCLVSISLLPFSLHGMEIVLPLTAAQDINLSILHGQGIPLLLVTREIVVASGWLLVGVIILSRTLKAARTQNTFELM